MRTKEEYRFIMQRCYNGIWGNWYQFGNDPQGELKYTEINFPSFQVRIINNPNFK